MNYGVRHRARARGCRPAPAVRAFACARALASPSARLILVTPKLHSGSCAPLSPPIPFGAVPSLATFFKRLECA